MKKLLFIAAAVLGLATAQAEDRYFWWMVADGAENGWDTGWTYARIKAVDSTKTYSDTYLTLVSADAAGTVIGEAGLEGAWAANTYATANNGSGSSVAGYGALISSLAQGGTWSYFLEVYNSDFGWNGMDENGIAMSAAAAYIFGSGTTTPGDKYDFGAAIYSNVPEPNSAMLLLLGLSALALRRKQKKV